VPPSPTTGVPNIVKVGTQIKVEDPRLPLDYRLGNSLDRVMSCPLGTISKRSRLEIRLQDRLEYELERALHHSVTDRWNREDTDEASSAFTRVTARTLALSPIRDTLSEGFSQFVTPWLLRLLPAGADLHPLESAALPRRTPIADMRERST
jgi:hypothetical protein